MTINDMLARFERPKRTGKGWVVRCPGHEDKTASLSIGEDNGKLLLKCFAGCSVAAICAAMGLQVKDLFSENGNGHVKVAPLPEPERTPTEEKPKIVAIYSYEDAVGREVYQALRLLPKSFRQRHQVDGNWVWSMDGVERVLYRLPEVLKADTVWIVEGEKDADNLSKLGVTATCNVGGAGKWLDGYTESLRGRHVVLCGDNDEPGRKHVQLVFDSVAGSAKSVRVLTLPGMVKDVSDYIETFKAQSDARQSIDALASACVPHLGGVRMPLYSMADIEPFYKAQIANTDTVRLDLGAWLPSLRHRIRPIIPGELVLLLGDTGAGKTALLQNIAHHAGKLKTVLFEMELPAELLYERFIALKLKMQCKEVEDSYRYAKDEFGRELLEKQFPHIYICPEPRLSLEQMESIVIKSELKIGEKPALILIDYVQLLQGNGNRYEKTSNIAEGLKVLAKATKTIVVVASQVSRPSDDDPTITLHSGKDSGSLENSAGLVIGAWRDSDNPAEMVLRVLKATKGGSGTQVRCNFDGSRMTITEMAHET